MGCLCVSLRVSVFVCVSVISPWGIDSEAFHSAEKKGIIPDGVFGIHQMATTGNAELTGRLLGITGVM